LYSYILEVFSWFNFFAAVVDAHSNRYPLEALTTLCHRYRVRELAVFGSVLRDDFDAKSDLDLLVEFEVGASVGFSTLLRMQRELSALLKRPVDLVPKGGLHPVLRQEVLATAEVIYAS